MPEQEVVAFCSQILELLELLAQQSPPLVHGLIQPEHIIIGQSGNEYFLTNFSVILAGGATQLLAGIDRSHFSSFTAPEMAPNNVDGRSDLYSLLATAYYCIAASVPNVSAFSPAQTLNPAVSSAFDAILTRGLRPVANQRYQQPLELRRDLARLSPASAPVASKKEVLPASESPAKRVAQAPTSVSVSSQLAPDAVAQMLPNLLVPGLDDDFERDLKLPRPEDLPPLEERNDTLFSIMWLIGILICLIAIVIWSRGLL